MHNKVVLEITLFLELGVNIKYFFNKEGGVGKKNSGLFCGNVGDMSNNMHPREIKH